MRLLDHISHVVVLRCGASSTEALTERLDESGCQYLTIDIDRRGTWREALRSAARAATQNHSPGIVLLSGDHAPCESFWMAHDAMVERLETSRWRALYIGHDAPVHAELNFARAGWIHCDAPPDEVSALGLRCELITLLADEMPDQRDQGPLTPADWFTVASWLIHPAVGCSHALAAWPPLVRGKAKLLATTVD